MFGNIFNQSTPGQLYHVYLEGGTTVLAEPADEFSKSVFYYWLLRIDAGKINLEVIPDSAIDLVVSPSIADFSIVYPPSIKKFSIPIEGPSYYAGISFESESAQQFFGKGVAELKALQPGLATTTA